MLRENVRQAVELLLEEVSTANRTKPDLFALLVAHGDDRKLTDAEAHEAMFQATVRLVMRLVVCLFAESRQLFPVNDPIYAQSYGVRSLYELLDEVTRYEGGTHALFNRQTAWHRLMALFRLIYSGSARTYDGPAASLVRSRIDDAMIGQGSQVIEAEIRRCVIGRNVRIEPGARLEESIIHEGSIIGPGARLRRVIADRFNVVPKDTVIGFDRGGGPSAQPPLVVLPRGQSVGGRAFDVGSQEPV